jgi:phosphate starvation-inducible PhoH-like protein
MEDALDVRVEMTGGGVTISGEEAGVELAGRVLSELYELMGEGFVVDAGDVSRSIDILGADRGEKLREVLLEPVFESSNRLRISPKTTNQRTYVQAMQDRDVVFAIGPAGTGKTYLAMAMAVSDLLAGRFKRIILTRPAVEAGEKLGFLPGDLAEKVNPYLRPLYDALFDMVGTDKAAQMIERELVEVAPLAFMRGRTLNDAFVILDEAQNTTPDQMKMFLTRLGFHSKAVITGDITQVDLTAGQLSGLRHAKRVLSAIEDLAFVYFDETDVVRHPLVRKIIGAYETAETESARLYDDGGDDRD